MDTSPGMLSNSGVEQWQVILPACTHTRIHLFTNISTLPTHSRHTYIPTSTHHAGHICRHSHVPPHLACTHMHSSANAHAPVCECLHAHTQGTYAHTSTHEHIPRRAHTGTPRLADEQKELLLGSLFKDEDSSPHPRRLPRCPGHPLTLILLFLCCTLRASDILSDQRSTPLLLGPAPGRPGCRQRPQWPSVRVPGLACSGPRAPHP